jgi:hypothetical protein
MRRRKATTMQVNARLETELVDRLAMRAKENRASLSEEIKTRLINSFEPAPSLADYFAIWETSIRDAVERGASKENIEQALRDLADVGAILRGTYTNIENKMLPYMPDPKVRELVRVRA